MPRNKDKVVKYFRFEGKCYSVSADNEIDAEIKKREKLKKLEEGSLVVQSKITLSKWADICISTYKVGVTDVYLASYANRVRATVLNYLGNMQLKSIKPINCQKCLNLQAGNSVYQIKQTKQILNFLFEKAVDNNLIIKNPAKDLSLPLGSKAARRAITEYEFEHLYKIASSKPEYYIFLATYYCGCRPSEARGLLGADIKIDKKTGFPLLHIRGTKSAKSDRKVPIPEEFYNLIKASSRLGYLFPDPKGNKLEKWNYKARWDALVNDMNISMGCASYKGKAVPPLAVSNDFVPYNLRHSFCTNLQKSGVDIRVAQSLMGHSDIKLTANIYTHSDTDDVVDAGIKLNNFNSRKKGVLAPVLSL